MSLHVHTLKGCAPAPLANYLKALGILRLVGEQADPQTRGWWEGEHFRLLTNLSKEALESFFLERYEPTPLLSPWNKGSGFFAENDPGLSPLESSKASRFERFRRGTVEARRLLDAVAGADAIIRSIKARTKTNKTFQSEEQRVILEKSEVFRACLEQLNKELSKPDIKADASARIEKEIATVQSLVKGGAAPKSAEATALKSSAGYKRALAAAERHFKALKDTLIPDCRRLWRGPHAEWLAAAVVLNENGEAQWPALLGTGGNDGRLDFTNNFMQQLGTLFDVASSSGSPSADAGVLLDNALWMDPANKLTSSSIGQYQPGSAGGTNSSTGFASGNLVNPWDFVLMLEGSLFFTACVSRRLDPNAPGLASVPFAVRPHAAGFATPGAEESQRGEQWMPCWDRPATPREVVALFSEARIQLDRKPALRPIDFARAIGRLGVARGIESFVRYGYLERNGQSTLAVPLGRFQVRHLPQSRLVDDLAGWMDRLQRLSRDRTATGRLVHAERRLADAVLAALSHDPTTDRWQAVLLAAAEIESLQASGTAIKAGPIPLLRLEWLDAVQEDSAEFRLALALGSAAAGYLPNGKPIDPIRHHWLPLEPGARQFKVTEKRLLNDPRVVMFGRDPIRDLGALLDRRLIESSMKGRRGSRLVAAPGCGARLDDLAQFLAGALDLEKIVNLSRAFTAIRWDLWTKGRWPRLATSPNPPRVPEAWLALRLANLPGKLGEKTIPAEPRIVRLLMSGDASGAVEIALARLRASGIRPPLQAGLADPALARLWAAALAIPIDPAAARRAAELLDPSQKGSTHV